MTRRSLDPFMTLMTTIQTECRKCGVPVKVPFDPEGFFSPGFIQKAVICQKCADAFDEQERKKRAAWKKLDDERRKKIKRNDPYRDD